jgi:predicted RNA-binding Zn-ribbon protein involved in translation (DUF1610 family)
VSIRVVPVAIGAWPVEERLRQNPRISTSQAVFLPITIKHIYLLPDVGEDTMGLRTQLVKCSNCGRQLEDTGQDEFTCHYCGKKTFRDLTADKELFEQKVMVLKLSADVKWQKSANKALLGSGAAIVALSILFLFAEKFLDPVLFSFVGMLVLGLVIMVLGHMIRKRYKRNNNKLQDLTGGRGFITLK